MISENMQYRVGGRALLFMVLEKLKYPFLLAIVMTIYSVLLLYAGPTFVGWQAGSSSILKETASVLFMIEKYGWFFTVVFAVFLGLTAVPEYTGLSVRFGEQAFYLRRGVLSYREIAIPYHQIQTINIVEHVMSSMFGLCSLLIVTSAHDETGENREDSEATLPYVHRGLAREFQNELLRRSNVSLSV